MPATKTTRALVRKPSSNPAWAQLEALAIRYLSLPAAPAPPQLDPEREQLRRQILQILVGAWVHMVADDAADGADAPDAPGRMERRDSALERVFRAEAGKLSRQHGNESLTAPFGGPTNLASVAQQEFLVARTGRYGKREQTLLSGLLSQWSQKAGEVSLYTFVSRAASSFLVDMWRQLHGSGQAQVGASGQVEKLRRASRAGAQSHVQEATPQEWVLAPTPDANEASGHATDWLDACSRERVKSPEQDFEDDEVWQALDAAVKTLPEEMQVLFELELLKHDEDLSDADLAKRLGVSRNTFLARRKALHDALRAHLGPAPAG